VFSVVPRHPTARGKLNVSNVFPQADMMNVLRLERADDGRREGVVVATTAAADRAHKDRQLGAITQEGLLTMSPGKVSPTFLAIQPPRECLRTILRSTSQSSFLPRIRCSIRWQFAQTVIKSSATMRVPSFVLPSWRTW
jgi:hypothetical protein